MNEPTPDTTDLLTLAIEGGDRNHIEVARRLQEMTGDERRALRRALERLDSALDEAILAERLARLMARQTNNEEKTQ